MTKYQGLSEKEVAIRRKKGQINGKMNVKTKSVGEILFTNVFTLFNFINICLAICLLLVNSYKNILFLGVVFFNSIIGVIQEIRSKITIDKLSLLSASYAMAVREGQIKELKNEDIVIDDILLMKSGNQVCVDSIILEGICEVNESLLTGETDPVMKKDGDEILSGSYLISGNITARAIHVGHDNYVNKITSQAKYLKRPNSDILKSIKQIIKAVSIILLPIGVMLFLNQLENQSYDDAVVSAVAGILGMIPSGLVLLTSIVMAVSVVRLGKKNTLVQEMYCIETLARVDTLCLDKTGTITEGTLSVEEIISLDNEEELKGMIAGFVKNMDDDNPTYNALKKYVYDNEMTADMYGSAKEVIRFSSEKKRSMVSFENGESIVIGAMEFTIASPSDNLKELVAKYSKKGMRVLVVSKVCGKLDESRLMEECIPSGIVVFSDTIRTEAKDTFKYFLEQGVRIKVISGDNPLTVSNVAKRAGIPDTENFVDATTLTTDEKLCQAAEEYTVFGRVTPNQKLGLIKALKKTGHTVAMTGDGVNDVMALKEADCSIAMQSGSDAARNVSQIVLMDSNFANMPEVVAEGRKTINNLQRSASLYLTKTIYSTILALIFVILPSAFPFVPVQLTFIGALTIGIPSFILALESNVSLVKGRFITNVMKMALPGALLVIINVVCVQIYAFVYDISDIQMSTMSLYGLAIAALMQLVKCCRPFNHLRRLLCIILIALFEVGIVFFKKLLDLTELEFIQYVFMMLMFVISIHMYRFFGKMIEKFYTT